VLPPVTFEFLNKSSWSLVHISWHLSPSQRHIYLYLLTLLGNDSIKNVTAATNTRRHFWSGVEWRWICDRWSVGQYVLVSGRPLGPMTRFPCSLVWHVLPSSCRAPSLTRGRVCILQCTSLTGQSREGLVAIYYCLIWDWVPFSSPLTTRRVTVGWKSSYCVRSEVSRRWQWRMLYSWMWCRVALVRTDVSEESIVSIIRVKRISQLVTALAVTRNWSSILQLLVTRDVLNVFCWKDSGK
jgi:hypothetical protein